MPKYSLLKAKQLVKNGDFGITERVREGLINHGYYEYATTQEIFAALTENDYYKTVNLVSHKENISADVYKMQYNNDEWYIKFYIDNESVQVEVWSLKSW